MDRFCFLIFAAFSLCLIDTVAMPSDSVRIKGANEEYAGFTLVFEHYSNFITSETKPLLSLQIDDEGVFDYTFPLEEITYAFVDLGRYRAHIYFEPGKKYEVVFPPFEPRTDSERLSPHFQPQEVVLGIANEESRLLNRNITEFEASFEYMYSNNAVELFVNGNDSLAMQIEERLDNQFIYNHPFFRRYKELSFFKLWHMTVRRQERFLIDNYFSDKPVEYQLPVYHEVFRTIFSGFFPDGFDSSVKEQLREVLGRRRPFNEVVDVVKQDTLFAQQEFAELVLLYGLYDSFHRDFLREETVFSVVNSARETGSSQRVRNMADGIYRRITMLRPGSKAPGFSLLNIEGERVNLTDYEGRYLYLNFIHTENYSCLRDLQTLKSLSQMFDEVMDIVTIVIDEDYEAMVTLLKEYPEYDWDFLHFGANSQVIFDYNIMAVPAYYLIAPDGTLAMSPAPTPEENFRERFITILRNSRSVH
ncbi:redoxin domain-containing protein [Marinilabiliaceae bacterium ANBcel2]|nr:redoxin domain-containing protein [Marinilabiliaceae bacterium ANBcel2]